MNCSATRATIAVTLGAIIAGSLVFSRAAQAKSGPKTSAAATIPQLENDVPAWMKKGNVPGLSMAVIRDGKTTWVHGFGVKNAKTGQPVSGDTVFEAASLSKPVFAYGVLKLVEQGKLGLDVPLTTYLSKPFVEGDERLAKITARIVLSHRTGFPNWRGADKSLPIYFTPSGRFSYSGEGYIYLQRVVEQITGKPLNDYMTEAVFKPLGMTSSSYIWRTDFDERTATGHNADGDGVPLWKPKEAGAASTLNTTARDYALFVAAVLNGKGLKPAMLHAMETPQIALDPECRNCTKREPKELSKKLFWGLGWGIQRTDRGDALWHWGDNGEFKCFVMAEPKTKSGVIMFTNSENGLAIAKPVIDEAMGAESLMFAWLKYDSYDSAAVSFGRTAIDKGAATALEEFGGALKSGAISEDTMTSVAYRLWNKRREDAIRMFQLNVELYPQSSNAYDNMGAAYMELGDKTHARASYEKSLALDPTDGNAAEKLKKLNNSQTEKQ
jgi:CubicO group peptidase (beta-lactamase class C family)